MKRIILALVAVFIADGCAACHEAPAESTLKCEVVNAVVDCTTSNVISDVAAFEPVLNWALGVVAATAIPIDWTAFGAAIAGLGLEDAGCIAAELEKDITAPANLRPAERGAALRLAQVTAYEAWYQPWRAAHFPPQAGQRVMFRLRDGSIR